MNNYGRRSLVETAMYRFKTLTGANLHSRNRENQIVESKIRCKILNRCTIPSML